MEKWDNSKKNVKKKRHFRIWGYSNGHEKNNELTSSLFFSCPIDCPRARGRVLHQIGLTPGSVVSVTNVMVP